MKRSDIYHKTYQIITNPYLISAILLVLLLMTALPQAYMGNDEGIWNYVGHAWVKHAIPPYAGTVENKTPGIFILFAISNLLFGVNVWFPRVLGVLAMVSAAIVIYLIGRKLHDNLAGVFAMILFGGPMTWQALDGRFSAQTESFMVLFTLLAFFTLISTQRTKRLDWYPRGIFISGCFMGIAISFKQIALFSALALFTFYLLSSNETYSQDKNIPRDFLLAFAGIICANLLSIIPLLISNVSLADYWNGAWMILLQKTSSTPISMRITILNYMWTNPKIRLFYPLLLLFIIQKRGVSTNNIPFWGIIFWLLLDFIGTNASGRGFGHQIKQVMPALALTSGLALSTLLERKAPPKKMNLQKKIIAVVAIIIVLRLINISVKEAYWAATFPSHDYRKELGIWIKDRTKKQDYIYITGRRGNPIQAYSERKSSSRYFNSIFLSNTGAKQELMNDLHEKPPKFILLDNKLTMPTEIAEIINRSYQKVFTKYKFTIFKSS